jgi:hypothetical protein
MNPIFFLLFDKIRIPPKTGKKILLLIIFQLGGTALLFLILNYLAFGGFSN